eukprot:CAMPEP_0179114448 /NCGR_PEP_ID=MMETSP0796-20121207/53591_1 /TAXON_ID=73915 /ORGANISM="Pyrodinium bahamense, Strain pbaha01" /LENGTH=140 /DNA_ID=CAMNT_0020812671 /DNA_START=625 /DNA_END=1044 /DNA_ORIENTATION=-
MREPAPAPASARIVMSLLLAPSTKEAHAIIAQQLDLHWHCLSVELRPPVAGGSPVRVWREDHTALIRVEVHAEDRSAGGALGVATHGDARGQRTVPAGSTVLDAARAGKVDEWLHLEADRAALLNSSAFECGAALHRDAA